MSKAGTYDKYLYKALQSGPEETLIKAILEWIPEALGI
jgi:hypothetical protein